MIRTYNKQVFDFKYVPKSCPQCGRFMGFKELERHPETNEVYQRLECGGCSQVDHDFIGFYDEKKVSE